MEKYKIGYTQGVYDMFHIGHLNLLNNAKKYCDRLVVGVNSDRLVEAYKNKTPVIDENSRQYIVGNIKAVDECIVADTLDKIEMHKKTGFDVIFIGDEWKGNSRWKQTELEMKKIGVSVIYLPHTSGISSTELRTVQNKKVGE